MAMNFAFITDKVQATVLIDTTREIHDAIKENNIVPLRAALVMLAVTVSVSTPKQTRDASTSGVLLNLVEVLSIVLVGIISTEVSKYFPDRDSVLQLVTYGLVSVGIIALIESAPERLSRTSLTGKLKFSFTYATATRIQALMGHNWEATIIACIVGALVLFSRQQAWLEEDASDLAVVSALVAVVNQLVLNLSIMLFIDSEVVNVAQNIVYCLGVVIVVSFIVTLTKAGNWQNYALWRVGDILMEDIKNAHLVNAYALTVVILAIYLSSESVFRHAHTDPTVSVYMQLMRLLAASSFIRALLDATMHLPALDLITLRFLLVLGLL